MYGQLKTVLETRAKKGKASSLNILQVYITDRYISVVYIHEMTHFVMQYASKR